ncbi:MAG: ATP-binding protein [Acidobacteria bacterium]|nr:ATP-binding protein [Acidobacteriota bacterium]
MFERRFWHRRLAQAWDRRSIIWLMGVRRAGKSVLAQSLPSADYYDCELPRTRARLADPEAFLQSSRGRLVILDEIHRLPDPTELLKIAADHFPDVRILATGSSTLGASARFRDTLAGRKEEVWLTPMVMADLADFGATDIQHRLLRGGLPPFFTSATLPEGEYQEWLDAFWARDIQELFRLERQHAFKRLVELLMIRSGGIFDATSFARECEISRTTVSNYVAVLEATFVVHLVRPFAGSARAEIVSAPKAYGFDTGFICHERGWTSLRRDDLGTLWEHLVLNELQAHIGRAPIRYWQTKHGTEVDFVIAHRGQPPVAIECKWSASEFDPAAMKIFRTAYPEGPSFVVTADLSGMYPYTRTYGSLTVTFISLDDLIAHVTKGSQLLRE